MSFPTTDPPVPAVPTRARDARAGREAQAEREFAQIVGRVEAAVLDFQGDLEQDWFFVGIPPGLVDRIAQAYREGGWIIDEAQGGLRFELPAPVDGAHPDRRQHDGQPVLDFWRFVYERQLIYAHKVQGDPRPWTYDPVLRERFFTNIFRDLDPGTKVAEEIMDRDRPAGERLWNLMMYRRFNREETWGLIGYSDLQHEPDLLWMRDELRQLYATLTRHRRETGHPIFTDAHQVYPMPMVPGPDLTARFMRVQLELLDASREHGSVWALADKLAAARTRREAYRAFNNARIPGISNFLSWQLTMDCTYGSDPIVTADDDWAPITTGARFGAIMWKEWPTLGTVNHPVEGWAELPPTPPAELERFVARMRDEQADRFEERGLDFLGLQGARPLDMSALEHALCEYSKYVAASVGLPTRDRWAVPASRSGGARQSFNEASDEVKAAMEAIDLPSLGGGEGWTPAPRSIPGGNAITGEAGHAANTGGAGTNPAAPPGDAEQRFRTAMRAIHDRGEVPTGRLIFQELGMNSVSLNTRQVQWRRDELARLGYVRVGNEYRLHTKEDGQ
jgi:hypothetical protein